MGTKAVAPKDCPPADPSTAFSKSKTPDSTVEKCAYSGRKVVRIQWDTPLKWCSETAALSGGTSNYGDGETVAVTVTDSVDGATLASAPVTVKGNAFQREWQVVDVLPTREGKGGYTPRRQVDCRADLAKSEKPMPVRFVVNFPSYDARKTTVAYKRVEPAVPEQLYEPAKPEQAEVPEIPAHDGVPAVPAVPHRDAVPEKLYHAAIPEKTLYPEVGCNFDMELSNYLVRVHGRLKYMRGWAKERVELHDPKLPGGFKFKGSDTLVHWSKVEPLDGKRRYWNGTEWKEMPKDWKEEGSNLWADTFYKKDGKWVCRGNEDIEYTPTALGDWPPNVKVAKGRTPEAEIALWKAMIEKTWSNQFDIKRSDCASSRVECCRYAVSVDVTFEETSTLGDHDLVLCYENVRSYSSMWSLADDRDDYLAPHEFGHLLGAPDEYGGAPTTQRGNNTDGMTDGVDTTSMMCGGGVAKKRHFKGIEKVMAQAVQKEFGKAYTYVTLDKDTTLALPAGTPTVKDIVPLPDPIVVIPPGPTTVTNKAADKKKTTNEIAGTLFGGIVGAVVGGAIGSLFSDGKSSQLATGAVIGGVLGGAVGFTLGWMKPVK